VKFIDNSYPYRRGRHLILDELLLFRKRKKVVFVDILQIIYAENVENIIKILGILEIPIIEK